MSKIQHTPAPWIAKGQLVFAGETCQATFIAHCNPDSDLFQSTAEENARLIAAAPELLEALKCAKAMDILNAIDIGEDMRRWALEILVSYGYDQKGDITYQQFVNEKIETAITKARGE